MRALIVISSTTRDEAQAIAVDTAGRLLVAGWVLEHPSAAPDFVVLRYLTNGQLDPAFGGSGIVQTPVAPGPNADQARAIAIQQDARVPTHRVIAAGSENGTNSDFAVTRYWR